MLTASLRGPLVMVRLFVALTFESFDEILWCYHSNETSSAVLSHRAIYLVCSSSLWMKSYGVTIQ